MKSDNRKRATAIATIALVATGITIFALWAGWPSYSTNNVYQQIASFTKEISHILVPVFVIGVIIVILLSAIVFMLADIADSLKGEGKEPLRVTSDMLEIEEFKAKLTEYDIYASSPEILKTSAPNIYRAIKNTGGDQDLWVEAMSKMHKLYGLDPWGFVFNSTSKIKKKNALPDYYLKMILKYAEEYKEQGKKAGWVMDAIAENANAKDANKYL